MPGELAKAVCAVMQAVTGVQKTGHNTFGKYKYASDADLLRALQPAMSEHGLAMTPIAVVRENSTRKNQRGKEEDRCDVLVTYRLMHTSGEHVDIQAPGTGMDSLDKAPYKAMTGAFKYALRQTFAVPTGDDPELDRKPALKNRQAGRAPEWKQLQAAIGNAGLKYDDVRDFMESVGHGRVDSWDVDSWKNLAADVPALAPKVREFVARGAK